MPYLSDPEAPRDETRTRGASKRLRILLIEDEIDDAEILMVALGASRLGPHDLSHVTTLEAGLEAIRNEPHDVVLLDLSLPDSWGAETIARTVACRADVPIVVVSGHADEQWVADMTQAGAHAYLSKSEANSSILARTIWEAIERQRLLTKLARANEKATYRATHDVLTGLPNRRLFRDRFNQALAAAARGQRHLALLLLDLDRFKAINDTFGHAVGDDLLRAVANVINSCVRSSDTAARLGGDEFAILLTGLKDRINAANVAEQLHRALADPIPLAGGHFVATTSIGISIFPEDGQKVGDLFRKADLAMYHAKSQGPNRYAFYTDELTTEAVARLQLEEQLRQALERREFRLEYQPQVDVGKAALVSAEALIRWHSGERGIAAPAEFLALAEQTRLILPIGEWVLHTACRQGRIWQDRQPGLRVAVNVSPCQLADTGFVESVRYALRENGLPADLLELEVTEAALTRDERVARETLEALGQLGVRLVVDDFGTGYSSLAALRRLPLHALKIDPSFVRHMTHDSADETIVSSIVRLAQGLGLSAVAEGVETLEQRDAATRIGCSLMQGHLFGRATGAEEFQEQFEVWTADATGALPAAAAAEAEDSGRS